MSVCYSHNRVNPLHVIIFRDNNYKNKIFNQIVEYETRYLVAAKGFTVLSRTLSFDMPNFPRDSGNPTVSPAIFRDLTGWDSLPTLLKPRLSANIINCAITCFRWKPFPQIGLEKNP